MIAIVPPDDTRLKEDPAASEGVNIFFIMADDGSLMQTASPGEDACDVDEVLTCLDRLSDLSLIGRRVRGSHLIYFVPEDMIPKVAAQLREIARRKQVVLG